MYFLACDQARSETTRKNLFIGAYGSAMVVEGSFPAFLPSLSLIACLRFLKRKENVTVRVTIPGVPEIQEHKVPFEAPKPADAMTYILNLSPCVIPRPGTLRVDYVFEDGHTESGELEVMAAQDYKASKW
ncbi:MAG: hypothetical protein QM704_25495 [Anaeromyxobacteraceae bacterium]